MQFNSSENEERDSKPNTNSSPPEGNKSNIGFTWMVPTCCVEGWGDCQHVSKPEPKNYNENLI